MSVVVSTLDRPDLLVRCLRALAAGRVVPDEVVVVDQGDGQRTAAALGEVDGLLVRHVPDPRRGLSASQNLGVERAGQPIVAVVDDDCIPDERWVEVIRGRFDADERLVLLTGRILPAEPDGERTAAVSSRTSTSAATFRWPTLPWLVGSGGNFAVDRSSFLRVGGNDVRLGTGSAGRAGNDLDLFYRLLRVGASAAYEPDLLVLHERVRDADRRARRWSYGFGVGACVGKWVREGDRWAVRVLFGWLLLRTREARGRPKRAALREELAVLGGTVAGLAYGLRLARRSTRP